MLLGLASLAGSSRQVRRAVQHHQLAGLRSSEALLQSYPKSGSTWVKFVLGEVIARRGVDFDTSDAMFPNLPGGTCRRKTGTVGVLRTHEPLRVSPRRIDCKVVQVVRSPLQVLPSYLSYLVSGGWWHGSPEEFYQRAVEGSLPDQLGSWGENVATWADVESRLVVRYEDLVANPVEQFERILVHIGRDVAPEVIETAVVANSRAKMRSKEASSRSLASFQGDFVGAQDRSEEHLDSRLRRIIVDAFSQRLTEHGYTW